MDKVFTVTALTMAVNMMQPAKTPVLDKVFGRKKPQLTDQFAWEIKVSSERLMKNIRVSAEAEVRDGLGRKHVSCTAPRFSEKRFVGASDLNAMRAFGAAQSVQLLTERVGDEQFDMRQGVDLTREFMAVKALTGQVVDESGAVLVDYNFPAAQKPVLTGDALWTDADSDPVKNIRAWKKQTSQAAGLITGFYGFCGSAVMDALLDNSKALELMKYTAGRQIAEEGRITRLAGTEIEEYIGSYLDADGDRQDFIAEDAFVLVGVGPDTAAELYAPVVDLKAPTGVGKGKKAQVFFSKSWEVEDPSGRWIKVEARPLPVVFRPQAIICATVV